MAISNCSDESASEVHNKEMHKSISPWCQKMAKRHKKKYMTLIYMLYRKYAMSVILSMTVVTEVK